ncbi:hypothetical protein BGZ88_008519 [Linnemannia elongata]|nr:hypothetical protein BGZ88_008519 [Linnemannia elongata]
MDFTFTVPSGIPPITFGSSTSTTTSDATSPKQPTSSTTTTSAIDSLDEHISLKRIHGVGDTKQWRRRLIHQIEDRIKDRREAIHNAQRRGFVGATGSSGSGNESGVGSRATSGGVGDEFSRAALPGSQGGEAVGPSEALVLGGDSYISEEEERRIVAEVWEAFKNENYEALALAFQGMTDKELEDIEQEILQHNYATESDPMYEAVMDMEENHELSSLTLSYLGLLLRVRVLYVTDHQEMELEKEEEGVDFDSKETLFSTSPMPPTLTAKHAQDSFKSVMTTT